jgi:hypothetical protein
MKRSPSAAVFLSLLPGLGHIYVGQAAKGFLIGLSFVMVIHLASEFAGPLGILIPFILLYAMVDAHRTAVDVNRIVAAGGIPPKGPDFGLTRWWGYVLIGLGVLFMLDNFDLFELEWILRLWPLGLIALGIFILRRPQPMMPDVPYYPPPPQVEVPPQSETASEEHGNV